MFVSTYTFHVEALNVSLPCIGIVHNVVMFDNKKIIISKRQSKYVVKEES